MLHILVSNSTYERTDILGACQDNFVSPKHITTTEATSPLVLYNSTVTYSHWEIEVHYFHHLSS